MAVAPWWQSGIPDAIAPFVADAVATWPSVDAYLPLSDYLEERSHPGYQQLRWYVELCRLPSRNATNGLVRRSRRYPSRLASQLWRVRDDFALLPLTRVIRECSEWRCPGMAPTPEIRDATLHLHAAVIFAELRACGRVANITDVSPHLYAINRATRYGVDRIEDCVRAGDIIVAAAVGVVAPNDAISSVSWATLVIHNVSRLREQVQCYRQCAIWQD